jgi:protein phosphatase 2C family protein 2/3
MGDTLSRPITDKVSEKYENDSYKVAASAMQGWRRGMEDAHTSLLELEGAPPNFAFFGVFDGHCGQNIAKYCGDNLYKKVVCSPAFVKGNYEEAILSGFLGTDEELKNDPVLRNDGSGCTAVIALLTDSEIYCGNAGDSRCVLCSNGKAVPLSQDHKPSNDQELKRIQQAGGFVSCGRVNGNLALSRAIGDFEFKQNKNLPAEDQAITAKPDVTVHKIIPEDEFLILACDGVWDVMSSEALITYVRQCLFETQDLASICEKVFEKCLAPQAPGVGCDNMTMVLVLFSKNWEKAKPVPQDR